MLEMMILGFRRGWGSRVYRIGALLPAHIVSSLYKQRNTRYVPRWNSCWQLTEPFSSLSKWAFHCHACMSSIFVLHVCSEAAQVNVQSFTSAGTVRWDRRLLGIDGIRDYSESQFLIWMVMSFTAAPAASFSHIQSFSLIALFKAKNIFFHSIPTWRKVTIWGSSL